MVVLICKRLRTLHGCRHDLQYVGTAGCRLEGFSHHRGHRGTSGALQVPQLPHNAQCACLKFT
jgi:hypothetical protein